MSVTPGSGIGVQFRPPRPADEVAEGLRRPAADRDGPRWCRSLAAVLDGQVVGFATLALSPAPSAYFCEVSVSPPHRRRGLGTGLFTALQQVADRPLPIVGRVMASQPLRRPFAEHLGGSVLMHCPMPSIDPTSAAGRRWVDAQALPEGYATVPMAGVAVEEVQAAWAAYYTWAHQPFGAVHADALPTVWDDYRSGVDDTLSYLCRDASGQIVALSLVSPEVWDGRTFVVAETVHRDQPHGLDLLKATVAASLRALAERGVQRVELEGHSTDAHIPQLFETLPPGPSDPLDIYRLPSRFDAAESPSPDDVDAR